MPPAENSEGKASHNKGEEKHGAGEEAKIPEGVEEKIEDLFAKWGKAGTIKHVEFLQIEEAKVPEGLHFPRKDIQDPDWQPSTALMSCIHKKLLKLAGKDEEEARDNLRIHASEGAYAASFQTKVRNKTVEKSLFLDAYNGEYVLMVLTSDKTHHEFEVDELGMAVHCQWKAKGEKEDKVGSPENIWSAICACLHEGCSKVLEEGGGYKTDFKASILPDMQKFGFSGVWSPVRSRYIEKMAEDGNTTAKMEGTRGSGQFQSQLTIFMDQARKPSFKKDIAGDPETIISQYMLHALLECFRTSYMLPCNEARVEVDVPKQTAKFNAVYLGEPEDGKDKYLVEAIVIMEEVDPTEKNGYKTLEIQVCCTNKGEWDGNFRNSKCIMHLHAGKAQKGGVISFDERQYKDLFEIHPIPVESAAVSDGDCQDPVKGGNSEDEQAGDDTQGSQDKDGDQEDDSQVSQDKDGDQEDDSQVFQDKDGDQEDDSQVSQDKDGDQEDDTQVSQDKEWDREDDTHKNLSDSENNENKEEEEEEQHVIVNNEERASRKRKRKGKGSASGNKKKKNNKAADPEQEETDHAVAAAPKRKKKENPSEIRRLIQLEHAAHHERLAVLHRRLANSM